MGLYTKGPREAALDIHMDATVYGLHQAIQNAVKLDRDHRYMFHVARRLHGRRDASFSEEDDFGDSDIETSLAELFPLPKDRRLFYKFDVGDERHRRSRHDGGSRISA